MPRPPRQRATSVRAVPYMTRDAARRLKSAKRAARAVLKAGGTVADAAAAAQAFGTPADGADSDCSESDSSSGHDGELAQAVTQLSVHQGAPPDWPAAPTSAERRRTRNDRGGGAAPATPAAAANS